MSFSQPAPPTPEELAAIRNKLQRDLFRLLDEMGRMHITARHRDHWRYQERLNQARTALQKHDSQWGEP